ncbi:hypothetical protein [Gibbsiella quercinecans]|uniref:hypothetical protein n=1 Tax=Gibbsiella quercinecans TaxID=929813 RepID=UPI0011C34E79|nr:hypothetical protein [Gibbsiella quercinecans]
MEWLTLVATSAVISAIVSGLVTIWNSHQQRASDERKRLAELAMKMAITEWEKHLELAGKRGGATMPPEVYLYRYSLLLPLIEKGELSRETVVDIDRKVRQMAGTRS